MTIFFVVTSAQGLPELMELYESCYPQDKNSMIASDPDFIPTSNPILNPSALPTHKPIAVPTAKPIESPTIIPIASPTATPTVTPTATPTHSGIESFEDVSATIILIAAVIGMVVFGVRIYRNRNLASNGYENIPLMPLNV